MNPRILNREFQHPADGYYHIEAKGFHPLTDGRKIVQVIDDLAITSVVNRFNADVASQTLRHGSEMLIDHEHFKHDKDKATTAYGWAQSAQSRPDGIYVSNRWTGTGKPAVDGGDYRFFSTEYDPAEMEEVKPADLPAALRNQYPGWQFLRPLRLDGLTLTNMHNNRGQRPITNRDRPLPDSPVTAPATDLTADNTTKKQTMKKIATELDLSADASEESLVGEIVKLKNRAGDVVKITAERDLLKNRVTELLTEQIDADLAAAGITDETIIGKLKPVLAPMLNRADRVDFIALLTPAKEAAAGKTPLTNRATAKTPDGKTTDTSEQGNAALAESEIQTYRLANRCSYSAARNAVRTAKPALFGIN